MSQNHQAQPAAPVPAVVFQQLHRGQGLPSSIVFRKENAIQVELHPSLLGTGQTVIFEVVGCSAENGEVTIVSGTGTRRKRRYRPARCSATTKPGCGGNLRLIARLNGAVQCGSSDPFSVCAHPCAVENGPEHSPKFYPDPDPAGNLVGMHVRISVLSDSGVVEDLDQVDEREIVSDTIDRTPSLKGHPKVKITVQKVMQPAPQVDVDDHTMNVMLIHGINDNVLKGEAGSWTNDQFDEFLCKRCGTEHSVAAVIPNSGYRLIRSLYTVQDGRLRYRVEKTSRAVTIAGRTSAAGPSGPLHRRDARATFGTVQRVRVPMRRRRQVGRVPRGAATREASDSSEKTSKEKLQKCRLPATWPAARSTFDVLNPKDVSGT